MNRHVNAIAGRLSLRPPQRESLEILDRLTEIVPPSKSPDAAAALKLTAKDLLEMKIIDGIIKEPLGGAHRKPLEACENIKKTIKKDLAILKSVSKDKLVDMRYEKIRAIGVIREP